MKIQINDVEIRSPEKKSFTDKDGKNIEYNQCSILVDDGQNTPEIFLVGLDNAVMAKAQECEGQKVSVLCNDSRTPLGRGSLCESKLKVVEIYAPKKA